MGGQADLSVFCLQWVGCESKRGRSEGRKEERRESVICCTTILVDRINSDSNDLFRLYPANKCWRVKPDMHVANSTGHGSKRLAYNYSLNDCTAIKHN